MGVSSVGSSTVINQTATAVEPADTAAANPASSSGGLVTCYGPNSGYTGPSGSVKQGDATYEVTNGSVSLNGTVIGTVNDAGDYSVKLNGQEVKGNVAGLIGAAVEGTLSTGAKVDNRPTGEVDVGGQHYAVDKGVVSSGGKAVGTINNSGDFDLGGVTGNVTKVTGAIYDGTLSDKKAVDNRPTGEVDVGGQHYAVDKGIVSVDGKKVGTINDTGAFNVGGVTGNVNQLTGAVYDGTLGNKKAVDNRLNGDVHLGDTDYVIRSGHVFNGDGKNIGTVDEKGGFAVKIDGRIYSGNVGALFGASYLADKPDKTQLRNAPSGLVSLNGKNYQVAAGKVFLDGKRVGSVNKDGNYSVKINGKIEQGNVNKLKGARIVVSGQ